MTEIERQQAVTAKHVAVLELDDRWAHVFAERVASYEQVIHRISAALDDATSSFTATHQTQSQSDAMAIQVIGLLATVTFAAGFEWAFTAVVGRLGLEATKIKNVVEAVENPANALASGTVNVTGTSVANTDAQRGQAPSQPGSAVGFMATNLEALAAKRQLIEQAFVNRRTHLDTLTPEAWQRLDVNAQNTIYQQLFTELTHRFLGVDQLKSREQLAVILERQMWASWIVAQDTAAREATRLANDTGIASGSGPIDLDPNNPDRPPEFSLGGYVEDRLNELNISRDAHVHLSGHAVWPNSPGDWRRQLFNWCTSGREATLGTNPQSGGT
jgi:hypothetical protein